MTSDFCSPVLRGQVSASDPDELDAGRVTYTRLTGDNSADLSLDPSSGVISIKVNAHDFDYEKQEGEWCWCSIGKGAKFHLPLISEGSHAMVLDVALCEVKIAESFSHASYIVCSRVKNT